MADDFNEKELSADVKSLQGTNATASHVKVNATATKRGRKQKKVKNKQIESRTVNELKIMVERKRNQKKKNVITEKSVNNITNTDKNKMQRMSLKRKYPVELEQAETKEIKKKIKVSLEELETKNEKGFEKSKMLRGSLKRKCTTKMTKIETINTVEETTKKDTIQEKNNMDDIEKNKIKEVIQNENEAIEVEDVFKGKRKNVKTIQQTNTNVCKDIDEKSAHDSSDSLEEKEPDQESEKAYSGMYQTKQTILNAEKEKENVTIEKTQTISENVKQNEAIEVEDVFKGKRKNRKKKKNKTTKSCKDINDIEVVNLENEMRDYDEVTNIKKEDQWINNEQTINETVKNDKSVETEKVKNTRVNKSAHDSSDCLEEKEPDQESEKAYSGMYQTKQTILNAEKEKGNVTIDKKQTISENVKENEAIEVEDEFKGKRKNLKKKRHTTTKSCKDIDKIEVVNLENEMRDYDEATNINKESQCVNKEQTINETVENEKSVETEKVKNTGVNKSAPDSSDCLEENESDQESEKAYSGMYQTKQTILNAEKEKENVTIEKSQTISENVKQNEAIEVEDVFKGKRKNRKKKKHKTIKSCKDIDEIEVVNLENKMRDYDEVTNINKEDQWISNEQTINETVKTDKSVETEKVKNTRVNKSAHDSSDCLEEKEPDQESEKAYSGMYQTKQTILNAEKEKGNVTIEKKQTISENVKQNEAIEVEDVFKGKRKTRKKKRYTTTKSCKDIDEIEVVNLENEMRDYDEATDINKESQCVNKELTINETVENEKSVETEKVKNTGVNKSAPDSSDCLEEKEPDQESEKAYSGMYQTKQTILNAEKEKENVTIEKSQTISENVKQNEAIEVEDVFKGKRKTRKKKRYTTTKSCKDIDEIEVVNLENEMRDYDEATDINKESQCVNKELTINETVENEKSVETEKVKNTGVNKSAPDSSDCLEEKEPDQESEKAYSGMYQTKQTILNAEKEKENVTIEKSQTISENVKQNEAIEVEDVFKGKRKNRKKKKHKTIKSCKDIDEIEVVNLENEMRDYDEATDINKESQCVNKELTINETVENEKSVETEKVKNTGVNKSAPDSSDCLEEKEPNQESEKAYSGMFQTKQTILNAEKEKGNVTIENKQTISESVKQNEAIEVEDEFKGKRKNRKKKKHKTTKNCKDIDEIEVVNLENEMRDYDEVTNINKEDQWISNEQTINETVKNDKSVETDKVKNTRVNKSAHDSSDCLEEKEPDQESEKAYSGMYQMKQTILNAEKEKGNATIEKTQTISENVKDNEAIKVEDVLKGNTKKHKKKKHRKYCKDIDEPECVNLEKEKCGSGKSTQVNTEDQTNNVTEKSKNVIDKSYCSEKTDEESEKMNNINEVFKGKRKKRKKKKHTNSKSCKEPELVNLENGESSEESHRHRHNDFFQFNIDKDNWKSIKPETVIYGGKGVKTQRLKSKWTEVFSKCTNKFHEGCVLAFKSHRVKKNNSRKLSAPYITAKAFCKGMFCIAQFQFTIETEPIDDNDVTVNCRVVGEIKHSSQEVNRRNLAGEKRVAVSEDIKKFGTMNTFHNYLLEGTESEMKKGNLTNVPNPTVLRKVIADQLKKEHLHSNIMAELQLLKESYESQNNHYIRDIGLDPFCLILFTDKQVDILKKHGRDGCIHIDATGGVISNIVGQKRPYLYSLVMRPDPQLPPVSVADMISTQHTIPRIQLFLTTVLRAANNTAIKQIETDFSYALIQAVLKTVNSMNIKAYIKACFDILRHKEPLNCTILHLCAAHMWKDFVKQLKIYKPTSDKTSRIFQYKAFAVLQNASSLTDAKHLFTDMCIVFQNKNINDQVEESVLRLTNKMHSIDENEETENEDEESHINDEDNTDLIDERTIKEASPFHSVFKKIASSNQSSKELKNSGIDNIYYCPEVVQVLLDKFMYLIPLWSGMMLCHGNDLGKTRDTNADIESWFKVLKHDVCRVRYKRPARFVLSLFKVVNGRLTEYMYPGASKKKTKINSRKRKVETDLDVSLKEEKWCRSKKKKTKYQPKIKKRNDTKDVKEGNQPENETALSSSVDEKKSLGPHVAKWGANVCGERLVNTCTIDNGLTILHLKACENKEVKKNIDEMNTSSDLFRTLNSVFTLMSENCFSFAKMIWVNYTELTTPSSLRNLHGDESDFFFSFFDPEWRSTTQSRCSRKECPQPYIESGEQQGITVSLPKPVQSTQHIVDMWLDCDSPCGVVMDSIEGEDEPQIITNTCHGVRRTIRTINQESPVLVLRVLEHVLYQHITLRQILIQRHITVRGINYTLAGCTMHKTDHYCAIVCSEKEENMWYDGLVGHLDKELPDNIDAWSPSHVLYCKI